MNYDERLRQQSIDRIMYKLNTYLPWLTPEKLSDYEGIELSDLIGFAIDLQEEFTTLAWCAKYMNE